MASKRHCRSKAFTSLHDDVLNVKNHNFNHTESVRRLFNVNNHTHIDIAHPNLTNPDNTNTITNYLTTSSSNTQSNHTINLKESLVITRPPLPINIHNHNTRYNSNTNNRNNKDNITKQSISHLSASMPNVSTKKERPRPPRFHTNITNNMYKPQIRYNTDHHLPVLNQSLELIVDQSFLSSNSSDSDNQSTLSHLSLVPFNNDSESQLHRDLEIKGIDLVTHRGYLLINGYLNEIESDSCIIPDDIIEMIYIWMVDQTQTLTIDIFEITFQFKHHCFTLTLNKSIAWFMNIYFQIICIPNLGPEECEILNDMNHDHDILSSADKQQMFRSNKIVNKERALIDCQLDCKQLVFQITLVDDENHSITQTDWHYYTRFNNLPIQNYNATGIWLNACSSYDVSRATVANLYPHLIQKFIRLTGCYKNQPTLQQMEGKFNNQLIVRSRDFDRFYTWFISMCYIILDLKIVYDRIDDPLIGLFYSRITAVESLQHKPVGTFILRLASHTNGLVITYKKRIEKIQNVLLMRIGNEKYRVGRSNKETLLFQLIGPWDKLKYLYTPNKLIRKAALF